MLVKWRYTDNGFLFFKKYGIQCKVHCVFVLVLLAINKPIYLIALMGKWTGKFSCWVQKNIMKRFCKSKYQIMLSIVAPLNVIHSESTWKTIEYATILVFYGVVWLRSVLKLLPFFVNLSWTITHIHSWPIATIK